MNREECKNIIIEHVNNSGGRRLDELVAWAGLYMIEGFSETFHPEMIQELLQEGRIAAFTYFLPNNIFMSFLVPKDTDFKLINLRY